MINKWNRLINFGTGLSGFAIWIWLTKTSPEESVNLALGVLLMLIGFGGRDTIIDIIKSWRGQ